jgi:hypothetical protein
MLHIHIASPPGPGRVLESRIELEPQHRRDHLPQDQGQVQPMDQAAHPGCTQDHETDRQHRRNVAALCGELEEEAHFQ